MSARTFTAARPCTIAGRTFARGEEVPADLLAKVDVRKLVAVRILRAPLDLALEEMPGRPAPVGRTRELLPLDTAAQRILARRELRKLEAAIEDAEAVGEEVPVLARNMVAAYKSMLADIARATRNTDTGDLGVSVQFLEALDETSAGGTDEEAPEGDGLPEGTIPTAEDGNDEGGSAIVPDAPGNPPPFAQDASAASTPANPPPPAPHASGAKGGSRKR